MVITRICQPPNGPEYTNSNYMLDFDEVRMSRLLSVNVGLPRDVTPKRTAHTKVSINTFVRYILSSVLA